MRRACAEDVLFYINAFGWVFEPRSARSLPAITAPYQERLIRQVLGAVGSHDLVIVKSRDMRATWTILSVLEWMWHFHDRQTFLLLSRKQELVDKTGDMRELFAKLDFMHQYLPTWLAPRTKQRQMFRGNLDTHSDLTGESSNEFAGVADRKRVIFLDEFSRMENQDTIFAGTRDVTDSRFFVFTPQGSANVAHDIAYGRSACNFKQIRLHWSLHAGKAAGLYRISNGKLEVLSRPWHDANPGYPFVYCGEYFCDGKLRSPWYDTQCNRAAHPMEIAQELDMDFLASDYQYFDNTVLDQRARDSCCDAWHVGYMAGGDFEDQPGGALSLWCHQGADGKAPAGRYALGADISAGSGATCSVAVVIDCATGEQVAEYADPRVDPAEFAEVCVALARWFCGARMAWEAPGPGITFGKRVIESGYRNVYWRSDESRPWKSPGDQAGWWPTKDAKALVMGGYRRAMASRAYTPRSRQQIEECRRFVYTTAGWVEHAGQSRRDGDPSGARSNHGDRPTAAALAWYMVREPAPSPVEPAMPVGSLAWRRELVQQEAQELLEQW